MLGTVLHAWAALLGNVHPNIMCEGGQLIHTIVCFVHPSLLSSRLKVP